MRRAVGDCIKTAAALLEGRASARFSARDLLGQEAAKMRERRKTAFLFFPGGGREYKRLEALVDASYETLAVIFARGGGNRDPSLAARLRTIAAAVAAGEFIKRGAPAADPSLTRALERLERAASHGFRCGARRAERALARQ